ncbi:MAG: hypothetical protein RPV21_16690 [Candidatus Sedimenticola sp. (ex Thyasira tokunagai)]
MGEPTLNGPTDEVDWTDTTISDVLDEVSNSIDALANESDWVEIAEPVWEEVLEPKIAKVLEEFKQQTGHELTIGEVVDWLRCVGVYSPDLAAEMVKGMMLAWEERWGELTPCQTWGLSRLGTCTYRTSMGMPLAADILDWWLMGSIDDDTVARTENVIVYDGDGMQVPTTIRYIPLSSADVWGRIGSELIVNRSLGEGYDKLLRTICDHLHEPADIELPHTVSELLPGLFYYPSTNGLAVHGRQKLYVRSSLPHDSRVDKELYVLGTSTVVSEVEVTAVASTYADPSGGPDLEGWDIELTSWRYRMWDIFDFHISTGLNIPIPGKGNVTVPDAIFVDLVNNPCPSFPAPKDYLIMTDSWKNVSVNAIPDIKPRFFLLKDESTNCENPVTYRR